MKNITVFILIMIITAPAAAQNNFTVNFNSGDVGISQNFPLSDDYNREITVSLLNIGIEDSRTNIGMEFSPYNYFYWTKSSEKENKNTAHSLANFSFYWNILNLEFSSVDIYFGPFTSINYLFVENSVNWNRYIFTGGVHLGLRGNFNGLNYKVFSFELGYRNTDGKSKYYMSAKIDLAIFFGSILYLAAASAASKDDN